MPTPNAGIDYFEATDPVSRAAFNAKLDELDTDLAARADLSGHKHTGAADDGSEALGPLDQVDFDDVTAPAAPGASKTRIYTVAGRLRTRAGASGADSQLLSSLDGVAEGDILYFDGTNFVVLTPDTAGKVLTTQGAGNPPSWENISTIALLDTQTPGGGGFSFASIPQTYRHLMIKGRAISSVAGPNPMTVAFNGGGGTNNSYSYWYFAGPNVSQTTVTSVLNGFAGEYSIGQMLDFEIHIHNYAEAQQVMYLVHAYGGTAQWRVSGTWTTGPVTNIDLGGSFAAGSVASLYGCP